MRSTSWWTGWIRTRWKPQNFKTTQCDSYPFNYHRRVCHLCVVTIIVLKDYSVGPSILPYLSKLDIRRIRFQRVLQNKHFGTKKKYSEV